MWQTPWTLLDDNPPRSKKRKNRGQADPLEIDDAMNLSAPTEHLFVNSASVEDTDLFFFLEKFPPPPQVVGRGASTRALGHCTTTDPQSNRVVVACRVPGEMAVFSHGGWDVVTNKRVFTSMTESPDDPLAATKQGTCAGAGVTAGARAWAAHAQHLLAAEAQPYASRAFQQRAALILRGHTIRPRSALWISLASARAMRLALLPDVALFFCK